jgi:hypothetical protein
MKKEKETKCVKGMKGKEIQKGDVRIEGKDERSGDEKKREHEEAAGRDDEE